MSHIGVGCTASSDQAGIHFQSVHFLLGLEVCQLYLHRLHSWHTCVALITLAWIVAKCLDMRDGHAPVIMHANTAPCQTNQTWPKIRLICLLVCRMQALASAVRLTENVPHFKQQHAFRCYTMHKHTAIINIVDSCVMTYPTADKMSS